MDTLKVAVVGAGFMGRQHLAALRRHPLVELAAVADVREDVARSAAGEYGAEAFADVDSLLAGTDAAAVVIATSDERHVEPALAALAAGRHVLLEKPIATTLADADRIIAAAETAPGRLLIGHTVRFDPAYAHLKHRSDAGQFGELLAVYARRLNHCGLQEILGGRVSVLSFLGVHDFDYLLWLTGRRAERVYTESVAKLHRSAGLDIEDHTFTTIRFEGGAIGCVEAGWVLPDNHPRRGDFKLEIIGDRGMGQFDLLSGSLALCTETGWEIPRMGRSLDLEIAHFVDCARGRVEPLIGPRAGRDALALSLAAQESARTGQAVRPG
jgi:predicted dehydrogenase